MGNHPILMVCIVQELRANKPREFSTKKVLVDKSFRCRKCDLDLEKWPIIELAIAPARRRRANKQQSVIKTISRRNIRTLLSLKGRN
jgi:hypothetical protein